MQRHVLAVFVLITTALLMPGCLSLQPASQPGAIQASPSPIAGTPFTAEMLGAPSIEIQPVFPGLGDFAFRLVNGDPQTVVGIYVEDLFALPVTQQPTDQPAYVSDQQDLLTQFRMAANNGVIGILAHNFLSGSYFFHLNEGDEIVVIFGDGTAELYHVSHSESFQALDPANPQSDFISLNGSDQAEITSSELFQRVYSTNGSLVFQTCIETNGISSWGRLFITAVKDDTLKFLLSPLTDSVSHDSSIY